METDLLKQRDATDAPQEIEFKHSLRPVGNSPSARHLTRTSLLCSCFLLILSYHSFLRKESIVFWDWNHTRVVVKKKQLTHAANSLGGIFMSKNNYDMDNKNQNKGQNSSKDSYDYSQNKSQNSSKNSKDCKDKY